jgi:hypothetical protein
VSRSALLPAQPYPMRLSWLGSSRWPSVRLRPGCPAAPVSGATSQPRPLLMEQGPILGPVGGDQPPYGGGADGAVAALAVRIVGGRASALQALATPVAVADLCGKGRVLAAPVVGLAGGDSLAGLAVGGEPAAADVEVAGRLGHPHRSGSAWRFAPAPSRHGAGQRLRWRGACQWICQWDVSRPVGTGGISWHERRAFVLVRWLSPFLGQGLPAGVGEECVRVRDHGFGALLRAAEDQVGDGPSLRG